jgi:hypothetical protein
VKRGHLALRWICGIFLLIPQAASPCFKLYKLCAFALTFIRFFGTFVNDSESKTPDDVRSD